MYVHWIIYLYCKSPFVSAEMNFSFKKYSIFENKRHVQAKRHHNVFLLLR